MATLIIAPPRVIRFSQEGSVAVFSWLDGGFGYALSGPLGRQDLLRVAEVVHAQLQP